MLVEREVAGTVEVGDVVEMLARKGVADSGTVPLFHHKQA